jgi:7,8-dihydropterin-6-yl-methyl-4-(beta-D-ribofuranosyl)aminobenzene 5'-phosphate synthase
MDKSRSEMEEIITGMKSLGVVRCGATHCTGEMQIGMFREAFGENYFEPGAGNKIIFN